MERRKSRKLLKIVLSFVMAVALVMGAVPMDGLVPVAQAETTATVTVNVTGSGTVTCGDRSATGGNSFSVMSEKGASVTLTLAPTDGNATRSVEYGYTNNSGTTASGVRLPINGTTATLTVPDDLKDGTGVTVTVTFAPALNGGADEGSAVALTDNTVTDLAGGWYKVESDITFDHTLYLLADTYLTIAEGKTMTVNTNSDKAIDSEYTFNVSGEGSLSVETTADYGIAIRVGSYVQTGATVTANGYIGIRCFDNFNASTITNDFTFSGGRLTATGSGYGNGIYTDNDITLSCTNANDFIQASSYDTKLGGTVKIAEGKKLTDGTNTYSGTLERNSIAGKNLHLLAPIATAPTATATYGQTLADVTLTNPEGNTPGLWSWVDSSTTSVGNVGNNTFKANFTPTDTGRYGSKTNVDVTVTVGKADAPTASIVLEKTYLYSRNNADSFTLTGLPTDCGTVTWKSPTRSGSLTFATEPAVSNTGMLSYTVQSGAKDTTGTVSVVAETQNYKDVTFNVGITLSDKIPVKLKTGSSVTLKNSILTYGQKLSTLQFNSAAFVSDDESANAVEGTLAWKDPDSMPDVGTTSAVWKFTPNDPSYAACEGIVAITVNKKDVTGSPTYTKITSSGKKLSDANLAIGSLAPDGGTIVWDAGDDTEVVQGTSYAWTYTPTDTDHYNVKKGTVILWESSPVRPTSAPTISPVPTSSPTATRRPSGGGSGGGSDSGGGSGSGNIDPSASPAPSTAPTTEPTTSPVPSAKPGESPAPSAAPGTSPAPSAAPGTSPAPTIVEQRTETTNNPDGTTTTTMTTLDSEGTKTTEAETVLTDGSVEKVTDVAKTDGSTEKVVETEHPDGSSEKTVDIVNADGSTEKSTETVKADGTSEKKTEIVEADGSTETISEKVKPNGASEKVTDIEKADGTTIHEDVKTTVKGKETSYRSETLPTGDKTVIEQVKQPSGDFSKATTSTTVKTDDDGNIISTSVKITVEVKTGATTTRTSFSVISSVPVAKKNALIAAAKMASKKKNQVALTKATTNAKSKTVTIPKTVKADGVTYSVVTLKKGMLKGNKKMPTKVKLKATGVTKVEKGAFKAMAKKGKIYVSGTKKQFKKLKKLIVKSGLPKGVKVKRA